METSLEQKNIDEHNENKKHHLKIHKHSEKTKNLINSVEKDNINNENITEDNENEKDNLDEINLSHTQGESRIPEIDIDETNSDYFTVHDPGNGMSKLHGINDSSTEELHGKNKTAINHSVEFSHERNDGNKSQSNSHQYEENERKPHENKDELTKTIYTVNEKINDAFLGKVQTSKNTEVNNIQKFSDTLSNNATDTEIIKTGGNSSNKDKGHPNKPNHHKSKGNKHEKKVILNHYFKNYNYSKSIRNVTIEDFNGDFDIVYNEKSIDSGSITRNIQSNSDNTFVKTVTGVLIVGLFMIGGVMLFLWKQRKDCTITKPIEESTNVEKHNSNIPKPLKAKNNLNYKKLDIPLDSLSTDEKDFYLTDFYTPNNYKSYYNNHQ